jgi:hypothetical protein
MGMSKKADTGYKNSKARHNLASRKLSGAILHGIRYYMVCVGLSELSMPAK